MKLSFGLRLWAACGILLLGSVGWARADIHDALVVHLTFDQVDDSGNPLDSSGRGNNGTVVRPGANSPYVPGVIGRAFQTQGQVLGIDAPTGNYITLGNPVDLKFDGSCDISFSWWGQVQFSAQHGDVPWLANKDFTSYDNRGWALASESLGLRWNFRATGETQKRLINYPITNVDDGQWHHYVVTFTRGVGGMAISYLDGVPIDSTPINSSLNVDFGYFPTNLLQDGTGTYTSTAFNPSDLANFDLAGIDDVGIWRRTLSADEVGLIYFMGTQGVSAFD